MQQPGRGRAQRHYETNTMGHQFGPVTQRDRKEQGLSTHGHLLSLHVCRAEDFVEVCVYVESMLHAKLDQP